MCLEATNNILYVYIRKGTLILPEVSLVKEWFIVYILLRT